MAGAVRLLLVAVAVAAAATKTRESTAFCYDKHRDCANWAKEGECRGANENYMLSTCPLSCRICKKAKCDDTSPSCPKWAKAGFCETKARQTLTACPTSCGVCAVACKDKHEDCGAWAAEGECNEHSDFMTEACPVSCNACVRTCVDRHDDCPGWLAGGECYKVRHQPVLSSRSGLLPLPLTHMPCGVRARPSTEPELHAAALPAELRSLH